MDLDRFENAIAFDLETTGTDLAHDQPVSYALYFNDPNGARSEHQLVKPTVPIAEEAIAVHGITQADVDERGLELATALRTLGNTLVRASREGRILVGMNVSFDLTILDQQLYTYFGKGLIDAGWNGPIFDTIVMDRQLDRFRKGKRTLTALCDEYGVVFENAHDALADSKACLDVAEAICERYPELEELPNSELLSMQTKAYLEWASGFNDYRIRNGQDPITLYETWPVLLGPPVISVDAVPSQASNVSVSAGG
jgi:DNA polymerase-3 subunit epsilon